MKLTLDGDSLEVTAVSSEEQDLLVELSIALKATDLRTVRRHGVDRKCALSSTNDIGDPNRRAFRRSTRGDLTRHGASLGSRRAMITAAMVRSKPASACCSGMRST